MSVGGQWVGGGKQVAKVTRLVLVMRTVVPQERRLIQKTNTFQDTWVLVSPPRLSEAMRGRPGLLIRAFHPAMRARQLLGVPGCLLPVIATTLGILSDWGNPNSVNVRRYSGSGLEMVTARNHRI